MQLKYNRQPSLGSSFIKILVKLLLAVIFFIIAIFLIEKINFPSPEKNTILILPMKLKSFKYFFSFLIILLIFTQSKSEEKIDIWKNKNNKKITNVEDAEVETDEKKQKKIVIQSTISDDKKIKIEKTIINANTEEKVFGLYDPEKNDLDLNMWSSTSLKS